MRSPDGPSRRCNFVTGSLGCFLSLLLAAKSSALSFAFCPFHQWVEEDTVVVVEGKNKPPPPHEQQQCESILRTEPSLSQEMGSGRKCATRLTFASRPEHLTFYRNDPPMALSKHFAGSLVLSSTTPPKMEAKANANANAEFPFRSIPGSDDSEDAESELHQQILGDADLASGPFPHGEDFFPLSAFQIYGAIGSDVDLSPPFFRAVLFLQR